MGHQTPADDNRSSSDESLMAALEEVSFSVVPAAGDGLLIRERGLGVSPQASQQVRADGVEKVVAPEVEAVNEGECRIRSFDFGHRHGAIEGQDWAR